MILAIDPGSFESGYVVIDKELNVHDHGIISNEELLDIINERKLDIDTVIIEMMTSYGMPIGKTSMDTLVWIGRFYERVVTSNKYLIHKIKPFLLARSRIKKHLCNHQAAKDKNITVAVKNRYKPVGGGSDPWKGTKKQPGPLYGLKSHTFSALAVAITFLEDRELIYDINK